MMLLLARQLPRRPGPLSPAEQHRPQRPPARRPRRARARTRAVPRGAEDGVGEQGPEADRRHLLGHHGRPDALRQHHLPRPALIQLVVPVVSIAHIS